MMNCERKQICISYTRGAFNCFSEEGFLSNRKVVRPKDVAGHSAQIPQIISSLRNRFARVGIALLTNDPNEAVFGDRASGPAFGSTSVEP